MNRILQPLIIAGQSFAIREKLLNMISVQQRVGFMITMKKTIYDI